MRIPNETIEEIKNRVDIVEVISDFVQLKKAGQNYKALSPFTDEKTPSFFVSPSKEIFKCFSTGKGGDAISFVMEHDGLSYYEALKVLAEKYGVEIKEEEQTDEEMVQQSERDSLYIALNFASEYFQDTLNNHEEGKSIGLSYFRERGFSDPTIEKFGLGYSLESWDGLSKKAMKRGFREEILEKAGLIIKKENRSYDRFRGRVIFPIHNLTGKVVAFGARTLKKDKKQPKYINSPETEVYHKSNVLYGIYQAKKAIRSEENCYLVEGYTDVISLHQSGIENVVASSGTSLTDEQIRLISRFSNTITVLFDGDKAGIKASVRGIDMILESGLNVKTVIFPDGEDPDSYAQKLGTTAFKAFLDEQTKDFIHFKTELYSRDAHNDPLKKAETIKEIVGSIAKIPDSIKRAVYIKETSSLLDIDESILIAEQNKILINNQKEEEKKTTYREPQDQGGIPPEDIMPSEPEDIASSAFKQKDSMVARQEREQIRLLVNYGYYKLEDDSFLSGYLLEELEDIEFETAVYKEIFEAFKVQLANGKVIDGNYLVQNGEEHIKKEIVNLISDQYELSEQWEKKHGITITRETDILENVVFKSLLRHKLMVIKKHFLENQEKLKHVVDHDELEQLLKIQMEYKRMDQEISQEFGNVIFK